MKWSKMASMIAPKLSGQYQNHYLVMGSKPESAPEVRANYKTIKEQLSDAVEIQVNDSQYLLIPMDSKQAAQAEELVSRIKTEVYLDSKSYESELSMDNLHRSKPHVNCALCYKPLSSDRSRVSNLGPICEHRLNQMVDQDQVETPESWNSIYSDPVEQGEILWVKTAAGVILVEVMQEDKEGILVVDRKGLEKAVAQNSDYTKCLENHLQSIPKAEIQGISRLAPKKAEEESSMFADLMRNIFND